MNSQLLTYSRGTVDRLFSKNRNFNYQNSSNKTNRKFLDLERKLSQLEDYVYDNPSSEWERLPGPKCNFNRCSNIQGCGLECECIPFGHLGHRCIPKCCIRAGNSKPCHLEHPGMKIQCVLPCHTYPTFCEELAFNPYHIYQGSLSYPNYPAIT